MWLRSQFVSSLFSKLYTLQVGVHELGLRKALLMEVQRYIQRTEEETAAAAKKLKQPEVQWNV